MLSREHCPSFDSLPFVPSFACHEVREHSLIGKWLLKMGFDMITHFSLSLVDNHTLPAEQMLEDNASLHREVLLSYRLLFGSRKKSRRIFNNTHHGRLRHDGLYDPFLTQLCGSREKIEHLVSDGSIQERDVYNLSKDFPIFGSRLLQLYTYARTIRPEKLREHFRDRRDRPQWFTYWALLVVGGLSVITSIVQIALAAAQLKFAIPPGRR
jgi:hypothetical protein